MKLNNFFIERITTLSNETDNKELKIKQSRVKKIAFYRTDYIGILKEVLKRNEIVYSLVYDQSNLDFIILTILKILFDFRIVFERKKRL